MTDNYSLKQIYAQNVRSIILKLLSKREDIKASSGLSDNNVSPSVDYQLTSISSNKMFKPAAKPKSLLGYHR